MKKILFIILASCVAMSSCKKSITDVSPTTTTPTQTPITPPPAISAVPSSFTQKVLIEEFTASWCGYCPNGITAINAAETAYPNRINAIAIHDDAYPSSEPMGIAAANTLEAFWQMSGIPASTVNRIADAGSANIYPGNWSSVMSSQMAQTAQCGIAMDATASTSTTISVSVHAGFKTSLTGDYRLVVYLMETPVSNSDSYYDQHNYMSKTGSSPDPLSEWYNQPPSIHLFAHKHVARQVLSVDVFGDAISSSSIGAGKAFVKTYSLPLSSAWTKANLYIVAAVLKYSSDNTQQQIMNSQEVNVGALKNWD